MTIQITDLCKKFDGFTLDNVNISLPTGFIMGFIGANGAGKSTTINAMMDIIKKDSGTIYLNGKDSNHLTKADKEEIGVVLDECCFAETLTQKNVNKILKNIYSNWDEEKFNYLCKKLAVPTDKKIKDYSKGMKMKLNIACALSHNAKLLILDEATSGLDPIVRDEILDMLLEFVQNEECSVFLSSHITSDLEKICDYITFIDNGKIIFTLEKEALMEKYAVLRCTNTDFENIDKGAVVGYRQNSFSTDALVLRDKVPAGFVLDKATIEDIMLYHIKEAK